MTDGRVELGGFVREVRLQRSEVMTELSKLMHALWQEQMKRAIMGFDSGQLEKQIEAWRGLVDVPFEETGEWRKAFYASQVNRITGVLDAVSALQRARVRGPLAKREKCPSCGMNGAVFEPCMICDAPACDNCMNASGGKPICAKCQEASKPEPEYELQHGGELREKETSDILLPSERWTSNGPTKKVEADRSGDSDEQD